MMMRGDICLAALCRVQRVCVLKVCVCSFLQPCDFFVSCLLSAVDSRKIPLETPLPTASPQTLPYFTAAMVVYVGGVIATEELSQGQLRFSSTERT
jgi:hypothetical protein